MRPAIFLLRSTAGYRIFRGGVALGRRIGNPEIELKPPLVAARTSATHLWIASGCIMFELPQCLGLNLPNSLARYRELLADFLARAGLPGLRLSSARPRQGRALRYGRYGRHQD